MKKIVTMILMTVSLIANQAIAGDFKGSIKIGYFEDKHTAMEQVNISIVEAIEIAKKRIDGRVIEAELEKQEGYLVWQIEILDKNNLKHEIIIDPVTGDVIYQERDD